jgi:hypothetical protein
MKAVVLANERSDHQQSWGGAFAAGLRKHGVSVQVAGAAARCDLLVMWGVRNQAAIRQQKDAGGEVCILERGYLGDRFAWSSVSFGGGLNGHGRFRSASSDPQRFKRMVPAGLQPWRRRPGYALLIGQVPGDMSLAGANMARWYAETADDLQRAGFNVRFRSHPVADARGYNPEIIPGVRQISGTLEEALADAALVATYNSNTAVDAVLAGVPTLAADQGSMAWEVTGRHARDVVMPDREGWAARLAWKQWSMEEMATGACWEAVRAA